jgi:hypothetical protein
LKHQFSQLGNVQSGSEKKIADLAKQLAQTKQEVKSLRKLIFFAAGVKGSRLLRTRWAG